MTSETESTTDSSVPTNAPFMFSTSMAPPRSIPEEEEELFTTVGPTIKEDSTDQPDFDVQDFIHENTSDVEFTGRGDTFKDPQNTTDSQTEEEPDDHTIIEINTIQPDIPIPDASLITEPMFAEGKTEETILDSGISTEMTSNLTDTSTETLYLSESTSLTSELHSTTPFPDYELETGFLVEVEPPSLPPQPDLSSGPPDSTTAIPTTTKGQPETTSSAPAPDVETLAVTSKEETAAAILIESETSAEDTTSSTGIHIFDESTTQVQEHTSDSLTGDDTETEFGTEFFTSAPAASAVPSVTIPPGTAVTHQESIPTTAITQTQNMSGKTGKHMWIFYSL